MTKQFFKSFDDSEIFYRMWNFQPHQKTLIIIHRGHEHSERLNDIAESNQFSTYNIFAFDLRGHGYTPAKTSSIFMDYVRDLDAFANFLKAQYHIKISDIFVVANSIGGVVASSWVHDFAPQIAGMALLAPAYRINLIVPLANEMITLGTKLKKGLIIKSYVKSKMLTHDIQQQRAYDTDSLITRSIDAELLLDLVKAGKRLVEDAEAIDTPTMILSAEKDHVVFNKDQKMFHDRLDTDLKYYEVLPNFFHGILFDTGKEKVYDKIVDFAEKCFNRKPIEPSLSQDQFSIREYNDLKNNVGNNLNFKLQRSLMKRIGKISNGMATGLKYGFDSGASLDYVYRNQPAGKFGIGKIMDKGYLDAIGWTGIRIRKQNLIKLVEDNIKRLKAEGRTIKILDVAGGTGNYLFDIKAKYPDAEIVINEFVKSNIEMGEKVIRDQNLQNIRFTNYDCFDLATYQKLNFEPNIVIISGIFELFGDNEMANRTIKGINSIAENNSYLVYTGQPWHPQLKMIAYVLNNHQNSDWIMRRRSQKELDRLFAYNKIEKEQMLIDDFGIFTVSSGRIKAI